MFNFFRKKTATRSVILNDLSSDFISSCLLGDIITPQKAFVFYRRNSSVATAVDIIADAFEQINPVIKLADGSMVEQHPVLDLLRNPNCFMTWSDFAARISRNYLLTNQSHICALGSVNVSPLEIYPVRPTYVSTTTGSDEYVDTFNVGSGVATGVYNRALGKQRINRYYAGALKELYRIAGFSSMSTDSTADSPLQAAALETNQQIKGRIHNLKVLENGGRLSLLVVFNEEHLTDDEHRARTQRINESWSGPENAGKIGIMSGGDLREIKEMGTTQKDMDYAELDRIASQAIYFRYRIPLPLISVSASTYNNLQTSIEMLYDFAVLPLADKLFTGLSRFLLPRFKIDINTVSITYNNESLQALRARRLDELIKRKTIGVETINELREQVPNREAIEGGDTLYQSATLVPVGVDITNDNDL